jgi:hypothetical protein
VKIFIQRCSSTKSGSATLVVVRVDTAKENESTTFQSSPSV